LGRAPCARHAAFFGRRIWPAPGARQIVLRHANAHERDQAGNDNQQKGFEEPDHVILGLNAASL
jgi:hypothetical protein